MASIAGLCRLRNALYHSRNSITSLRTKYLPTCRPLSTSDKKQDGADTTASTKTSNLPDLPKTWVSWGFDETNFYKDRAIAHLVFFSTVSLGLVVFSYIMYYYPDVNNREWCRREAFLELRRREAAGLPLVDPNYVPPSQIKLPSDQELGSYEIIL